MTLSVHTILECVHFYASCNLTGIPRLLIKYVTFLMDNKTYIYVLRRNKPISIIRHCHIITILSTLCRVKNWIMMEMRPVLRI